MSHDPLHALSPLGSLRGPPHDYFLSLFWSMHPMNVNDVFPSKYLSANDLNGKDITVTIDEVTIEEMNDGTDKPVIHIKGAKKAMVLNKTNAATIAGLYGPEMDNWTGERITLVAREVDFQGKTTMGLRVRPSKPTGGKSQKPEPEPEPAPVIDEDDIPF